MTVEFDHQEMVEMFRLLFYLVVPTSTLYCKIRTNYAGDWFLLYLIIFTCLMLCLFDVIFV